MRIYISVFWLIAFPIDITGSDRLSSDRHRAGVDAPVSIANVPDTKIPVVDINVIPDYPPSIEITGIRNTLLPKGSLHDPHNQQALGGIRILEDSDVVVNFTATDQAGLEEVICYLDDVPIERTLGLTRTLGLPESLIYIMLQLNR